MTKIKMPENIDTYISPDVREISRVSAYKTAAMIDDLVDQLDGDPLSILQVCLRTINAAGAKAAASLEAYHEAETTDGYEAGLVVYGYLTDILKNGIEKRDRKH